MSLNTGFDIETAKTWAEFFQAVFTILAIIAGGIWTYFNFFKGRTYRPRIEPSVSAVTSTESETSYLVMSARIKNVGLAKVPLRREGTCLRVEQLHVPAVVDDVQTPDWQHITTIDIFEDHAWIERGEVIDEQRLVLIPNDASSTFRVQLRVVSNQTSWSAKAITSDESAVSRGLMTAAAQNGAEGE